MFKIDVEGAEGELLGAADDLFVKKRPVVLVEVNPGSMDFVSKFLLRHKYRLLDADQFGEEVPAKADTANILALPLD